MGRLLEIALSVPVLELPRPARPVRQTSVLKPKRTANELNELNEISPPATYSQPAADVLNILVTAGEPVLHSQIVRDMAALGHSKAAAYEAIASCQAQRWIEHDLVKGYVLSCKDTTDEQLGENE